MLIKVGPFRFCGWGNCSDALLTAPRFETIVHFVWSGSKDEPRFGLDPVTGVSIIDEYSLSISQTTKNGLQVVIPWKLNITPIGDILSTVDEDEFRVFQTINKADE
ncbi:MAG: hypothetical protein WCH05_00825 [Chlorobiaceae bacterium]